jgi:hypothetical protein
MNIEKRGLGPADLIDRRGHKCGPERPFALFPSEKIMAAVLLSKGFCLLERCSLLPAPKFGAIGTCGA